jgi:ZIP family zinc transporter
MISSFANLNPVIQAFIATLFTWGMTTVGAASVFLKRNISQSWLDGMLDHDCSQFLVSVGSFDGNG